MGVIPKLKPFCELLLIIHYKRKNAIVFEGRVSNNFSRLGKNAYEDQWISEMNAKGG